MSLLYLEYCKRPYLSVYFQIYSQYKITFVLGWQMKGDAYACFIFVTKPECILIVSLKKNHKEVIKKKKIPLGLKQLNL